MNREFLESLGLEKEAVDTIMKEHGKSIQSVKQEEEEKDTTIQTLEAQLEQRDTDLEELKNKTLSDEDLKQQLEEMTNTYKTETQDLQDKLVDQKKQAEVRLAVTKAGAKNERAVMALLDQEQIKIDDDGVQGIKEQIEALQESDAYLFVPEHEPSGQGTIGGNPRRKGSSGPIDEFGKAVDKVLGK